jgi:hypothetical protein
MAVIGVMGEKSREAASCIQEWLKKTESAHEHTVIDLEKDGSPVDVLVSLDNAAMPQKHIGALGERAILIMNPDHKNVLPYVAENNGLLITYGFNTKDSVTASSVTESKLQICIQRDLPTLSGSALEQQEFCITEDMQRKDPEVVLAALTAVLICGVSIDSSKSSC